MATGGILLSPTTGVALADSGGRRGAAELNVVFALDGLRPDSVNRRDTPNIHRLRREGVAFARAHATVPTVTRANGAVWGTGMHPATSGILGNAMYIPEMHPTSAFSTADPHMLLELEARTGSIVFTETLAQRLHARGKTMVVVGSADPGGGPFLANPSAQHGAGASITYMRPDGPLTFPEPLSEVIRNRFGAPPGGGSDAAVDYAATIVNEYVLTELQPDVLFFWMSEPDHTQHELAVGSPESLAVLRNADRNLGSVLDRLEQLGMADRTNVFVVSDHGFTLRTFGVNVEDELIAAGLKEGPDSSDVVVANTGSVLVYADERDPKRIRAVTEFLQDQEWVGALYTSAERPEAGAYRAPGGRTPARGWVDGTLSLELVHQANPRRGADILVTFPWSSRPNSFGVRGSAHAAVGTATGPVTGPASGHGGVSPYDVTNTMIGWGPDLKRGVISPVPAGNVDLAPTILKLATGATPAFDGRVLEEALADGPDPATIPVTTRLLTARGGGAGSATQISLVTGDRHGHQYRYIDKGWPLGRH